MKHVNYFVNYLKRHVNLNDSRLNTLDSKVRIITDLLQSDLKNYRKHSQQGSYAHGTIIKPVRDNDEFDADILIFLKDDNFDPENFSADYVTEIYDLFRENANYRAIVRRKTRCVTIDYSGDFHLDIVPCIEYNGDNYICNRKDEIYELTDGDGYKNWFADVNRIAGKNNLKKVTRLLKFLRDHKSNFSIPSILLTTILGYEIYENDDVSDDFRDLPQSLKTLSNRVNGFLQANPEMPIIKNPVLPEEDFNRNWDQNKYRNFRAKFEIYNRKINEAFEEKDHNKSVKKWRELFGDKFGELISESVSTATKTTLGVGTAAISPTVLAQKPYASNE